MPYEPLLLGVGVVFNLLTLHLEDRNLLKWEFRLLLSVFPSDWSIGDNEPKCSKGYDRVCDT